jgi:hypothetical protein
MGVRKQPVDVELFNRTAPAFNCIDYPGRGPHLLPGKVCVWCGLSAEEIAAADRPDDAAKRPEQPYEVAWIWLAHSPNTVKVHDEVMARDAAHAIEVHRAVIANQRAGVPKNYVVTAVTPLHP